MFTANQQEHPQSRARLRVGRRWGSMGLAVSTLGSTDSVEDIADSPGPPCRRLSVVVASSLDGWEEGASPLPRVDPGQHGGVVRWLFSASVRTGQFLPIPQRPLAVFGAAPCPQLALSKDRLPFSGTCKAKRLLTIWIRPPCEIATLRAGCTAHLDPAAVDSVPFASTDGLRPCTRVMVDARDKTSDANASLCSLCAAAEWLLWNGQLGGPMIMGKDVFCRNPCVFQARLLQVRGASVHQWNRSLAALGKLPGVPLTVIKWHVADGCRTKSSLPTDEDTNTVNETPPINTTIGCSIHPALSPNIASASLHKAQFFPSSRETGPNLGISNGACRRVWKSSPSSAPFSTASNITWLAPGERVGKLHCYAPAPSDWPWPRPGAGSTWLNANASLAVNKPNLFPCIFITGYSVVLSRTSHGEPVDQDPAETCINSEPPRACVVFIVGFPEHLTRTVLPHSIVGPGKTAGESPTPIRFFSMLQLQPALVVSRATRRLLKKACIQIRGKYALSRKAPINDKSTMETTIIHSALVCTVTNHITIRPTC
ncbi:hypothetical protein S40293_10508 [Stachybotrys chartarum IBT 40293]|nr:hypothetical protein S40293_10508 [Stachybotrys chartarum IBT 40293]